MVVSIELHSGVRLKIRACLIHIVRPIDTILKGITMSDAIISDKLKLMLTGHNPSRVIDVRRKSDYKSDPSMIPSAMWMDPERVDAWNKKLGDEDVVIYCVRGGSVSKSKIEKLHRLYH
jgi:hypothetical protein